MSHYACQAQLNKFGDKTPCCDCTKHDCVKANSTPIVPPETKANAQFGIEVEETQKGGKFIILRMNKFELVETGTDKGVSFYKFFVNEKS